MTITGETGVFCIIGYPIQHSLSPVIHNAGFERHGLDMVFVPFALHPDNVKAGFEGLKALGVKGMTVTVPLKELVAPLIDYLEPSARLTGAVNTVVFEKGRSRGFNLDVDGVTASLERLGLDRGAAKAVVLGTGGAARAVMAALITHGVKKIVLLNRREERARSLRNSFPSDSHATVLETGGLTAESLRRFLPKSDILINTTPVGMYPDTDRSPVPEEIIPEGIRVLDAIYRPQKTALMAAAEARGCSTLSGLEWLVHQAARAFELWTGKALQKEDILTLLNNQFR